jgi:DNA-binding response OmpR family regulator
MDVTQAQGTVLVVEDDSAIADLVGMYLRQEGFRVLLAEDGERALEIVQRDRPVLVVLDIGLKGASDGFQICRRIREEGTTPVIIMTARGEEVDRVLGLELGADDYVTKPFSPREMVARVRAVLRRSAHQGLAGQVLIAGGVEVDTARREARVGGRPISLTAQEFDLLEYLARHPGVALTRRQILDGAWEPGWFGDERTVDVHVRQLRKKLGTALPIATVWGVGYRLE